MTLGLHASTHTRPHARMHARMHACTHAHTHTFNGLFSRTTWIRWHQKDKPFWILLKQEMMRWQWHQLDHMQIICATLQTDNHASTSITQFFMGEMLFLAPNQQYQSFEDKGIISNDGWPTLPHNNTNFMLPSLTYNNSMPFK